MRGADAVAHGLVVVDRTIQLACGPRLPVEERAPVQHAACSAGCPRVLSFNKVEAMRPLPAEAHDRKLQEGQDSQ